MRVVPYMTKGRTSKVKMFYRVFTQNFAFTRLRAPHDQIVRILGNSASFQSRNAVVGRHPTMKRAFTFADETIPPLAWQLFPDCAQKVQQIRDLEEEIEVMLSKKKRMSVAVNSLPDVKPKILRVYVRHEFVPATATERAHFILTVEGQVLDRTAVGQLPLGHFFDKVRVQVDKRFHPTVGPFEWSVDTYPAGARAQCFRVKFSGDKPSPVKIFLHRAHSEVRTRHEVAPALRELLPFLPADPAENEVVLAVVQYLEVRGLLARRHIRLTPELRAAFRTVGDTMLLTQLRSKVRPELRVC
jgi:hypothetical protein